MEIEEPSSSKKPRVPLSDRLEIIKMKKNGETDLKVSQSLSLSPSIVNYIWNKFKNTGTVEDIKPTGRPREVHVKEEKLLIEAVQVHPEYSLNSLIGEIDASFGKTKAHSILTEHGYRNYSVPEKWSLDDKHRDLRYKWAKKFRKLPDSYWKRVIFTDESIIQSNPHKLKHWVTDRAQLPLIQKDRWQASVLCWGAISFEGKIILEAIEKTMTAPIYLDILKRSCSETTQP